MCVAATTLLINVRCCTGTYRTNLATVSSYAYQGKSANVVMYAHHILRNSKVIPQDKK
jgi:hypothetical protein